MSIAKAFLPTGRAGGCPTKTTVIPLYQNDGYSLAETAGFEPAGYYYLTDFESAPL